MNDIVNHPNSTRTILENKEKVANGEITCLEDFRV